MRDPFEERERLEAEIVAMDRWYEELRQYIDRGLDDPSVEPEAFAIAVTRMTQALMQLKALYDRQWSRLEAGRPPVPGLSSEPALSLIERIRA